MAVGDVYKVRMVNYTNQQIGLTTFYAVETVATALMPDASLRIASLMDVALSATMKAWMSPSASYRGVDCRLVSPTLGLPNIAIGNDGPGAAAGSNLPQQVSGLIASYSNPPSRRMRGRFYIPFPSDTWSDLNGYLNAAGVAALQNVQSVIAATIVAGGVDPGQWQVQHRYKSGPATFAYTSIIYYTSRDRFATQRRRGQYGRRNIPPF